MLQALQNSRRIERQLKRPQIADLLDIRGLPNGGYWRIGLDLKTWLSLDSTHPSTENNSMLVINICGCYRNVQLPKVVSKRHVGQLNGAWVKESKTAAHRYMKSNQCIDHNNFDMLRIQIRAVECRPIEGKTRGRERERAGERGRKREREPPKTGRKPIPGRSQRSSCKTGKQKPQKRQAMSSIQWSGQRKKKKLKDPTR